MSNRLVRNREFAQIMTNHFRLNLNLVECLSVINSNNRTNHLRHDDHVTQMGLDDCRLFKRLLLLLCFTQLLDEGHWFAGETSLESSSGTGMDELSELLVAEIKELFKIHSAVGVLAESTFLLGSLHVGSVVFVSLYSIVMFVSLLNGWMDCIHDLYH